MVIMTTKCKDLETEIARMWGIKTQIVTIAIGALGAIKKGIGKQISKFLEISTSLNCKTSHC